MEEVWNKLQQNLSATPWTPACGSLDPLWPATSQISNLPGPALFQKGFQVGENLQSPVKGYGIAGEKWFPVLYTSRSSIDSQQTNFKSQALRLGIKVCVIREHPNSFTSFVPQITAEINICQMWICWKLTLKTDWIKSCM